MAKNTANKQKGPKPLMAQAIPYTVNSTDSAGSAESFAAFLPLPGRRAMILPWPK